MNCPEGMMGNIPIIYSAYCGHYESEKAMRSWKERLLSWPWNPWVKEKTIQMFVPDMYKIKKAKGWYILMHTSYKSEVNNYVSDAMS